MVVLNACQSGTAGKELEAAVATWLPVPSGPMSTLIPRAQAPKSHCVPGPRCRTLAVVFRFAVSAYRALRRAALTAALALLSSSSPLSPRALSSSPLSSLSASALDGARR
jgi:hypothetical protein